MAYEGLARESEAREETRLERNPDFIFRRIVDEAVLVPIHGRIADMECIYTLNEVGAAVWQRLERPATQAELERCVLDEYEAEPQAVARDLAAFLQEMVEAGAVRFANAVQFLDPSKDHSS